MLFLAILVTIITANSAQLSYNSTKAIVCDGIIFDGTYYDKELLFTGPGNSHNLMMDSTSGELFFSYTSKNFTEGRFVYHPIIKACHVESRVCRDIKGITKGYAIGYDPYRDNIYFGGSEGIFRYDRLTRMAKFFGEKDTHILDIDVDKTFYYVDYKTKKLRVYRNGQFHDSTCITSNVTVFLANQKTFYFANHSGVYFVYRNQMHIQYPLDNSIKVWQISEDVNGRIYFCADEGIFVEDKPFHKLKKIANVGVALGLAFINHVTDAFRVQYIYSTYGHIYILQPSKYARFCSEVLLNAAAQALRKPSGIILDLKLDFW